MVPRRARRTRRAPRRTGARSTTARRAADRLLGNMGASFKPYEHRLHERVSTALHKTLGADTLARLLAEGSALDDTSLVTQAAGSRPSRIAARAARRSVEPRRQPEQREERLGVEEERELPDPAVRDLEHLQRPRLVAPAARSACTGRTPASRSPPPSGSRASPGSRSPGPTTSVKMSSRPVSHMSYGGIDCVASSWISDGQRLHVVALEGLDVALQQLARRPRSTGARASGVTSRRVERRPRPLQRAVHRRDARLEQLRHLGRLPAQHLAEDQHRALARRQVLQRGDERQPDRLARDRHLGRIAVGDDPAVGDRLDPGRPRAARSGSRRSGSRAGPRSIGRARRSRPFSMSRQTFVAIRYSHERSDERPSNRSSCARRG